MKRTAHISFDLLATGHSTGLRASATRRLVANQISLVERRMR